MPSASCSGHASCFFERVLPEEALCAAFVEAEAVTVLTDALLFDELSPLLAGAALEAARAAGRAFGATGLVSCARLRIAADLRRLRGRSATSRCVDARSVIGSINLGP